MGLIRDGRNHKIRIMILAVVTKVEHMGWRQASLINVSVPGDERGRSIAMFHFVLESPAINIQNIY